MSEEIENALKCLEMDMLDNTQIELLLNYIDKLQKEVEEKTTILMAGAEKVKQLEKENTELKGKLGYTQKYVNLEE